MAEVGTREWLEKQVARLEQDPAFLEEALADEARVQVLTEDGEAFDVAFPQDEPGFIERRLAELSLR